MFPVTILQSRLILTLLQEDYHVQEIGIVGFFCFGVCAG